MPPSPSLPEGQSQRPHLTWILLPPLPSTALPFPDRYMGATPPSFGMCCALCQGCPSFFILSFLLAPSSNRTPPAPFRPEGDSGKDKAGTPAWSGGGEAHFHQVPEEHLPVLRAADHMCVALAQAAVQLILRVLMARVPGGEWSQSGG